MSFFQGTYLRVLTPQTINGVYPKMGPDGRQLFKETHLPLSARPAMDKLNRKLPEALKKKIEVVQAAHAHNGYQTIPQVDPELEAMRAQIAQLQAQNAALAAAKADEAGLFGKAGENGSPAPTQPKTTAAGKPKPAVQE